MGFARHWLRDIATETAERGDPLAAALMRRSVADGSGWMAPTLDWIVVGGESGPGARPVDVEWARSTVEQCKAAGVPVFVKQIGAKPFERQPSLDKGFAGRDLLDVMKRPRPPQMNGWGRITTATETFYQRHLDLNDRKGGDMEEWPADLRVRECPEVQA